MKLELQQANKDDYDDIIDLIYKAQQWQISVGLSPAWRIIPRESIAISLEKKETYVALYQGKIIGTLALENMDEEVWANFPKDALYLHRLAVDPSFHRQGVGKQIVSWAENEVRRRNLVYLRLDAVAINDVLCNWYRNLGFKDCGEFMLPRWTRASMKFEKKVDNISS